MLPNAYCEWTAGGENHAFLVYAAVCVCSIRMCCAGGKCVLGTQRCRSLYPRRPAVGVEFCPRGACQRPQHPPRPGPRGGVRGGVESAVENAVENAVDFVWRKRPKSQTRHRRVLWDKSRVQNSTTKPRARVQNSTRPKTHLPPPRGKIFGYKILGTKFRVQNSGYKIPSTSVHIIEHQMHARRQRSICAYHTHVACFDFLRAGETPRTTTGA